MRSLSWVGVSVRREEGDEVWNYLGSEEEQRLDGSFSDDGDGVVEAGFLQALSAQTRVSIRHLTDQVHEDLLIHSLLVEVLCVLGQVFEQRHARASIRTCV